MGPRLVPAFLLAQSRLHVELLPILAGTENAVARQRATSRAAQGCILGG